MPAAAVIPAPGAYINVAAVKEFVVESMLNPLSICEVEEVVYQTWYLE